MQVPEIVCGDTTIRGRRPAPGSIQMEALYFTLVAIGLYLVADRILDRIELAAGKRFEYRSLLFFAILLTLALATFSLIRWYTGNS